MFKILTNYLNFKSDYLTSSNGLIKGFEDSKIEDWTLGEGEPGFNKLK